MTTLSYDERQITPMSSDYAQLCDYPARVSMLDQDISRPDVRQVTAWDQRVAAELRRCRDVARLSRPTVCSRLNGLKPSALQNVEEGRQRLSVGLLFELCAVIPVDPRRVLVGAGVLQEGRSIEDWLAADTRLDELGREMVLAVLALAIDQSALRRQPHVPRLEH